MLSFEKYKNKYNFFVTDEEREKHASNLSKILEDPKFRVFI